MKHKPENIIAEGQQLFRRNGYHATGVSQILETCEIPKGTFYNYFESKEEFAIRCLNQYSEQIKKLISTYMSFTSQPPAKRVFRYFEQLLKINEDEGADSGCLLMNMSSELGGSMQSISALASQEFEEWIDLFIPTIEQAQQTGELTAVLTPRDIAKLLYTTVYGSFVEMKCKQSTAEPRQQLERVFGLLST